MALLVPLQLANADSRNDVFWLNDRPCSNNYCRPLSFNFAKKNKDYVTNFVNNISFQISKLEKTKIKYHDIDRTIFVEYKLLLTMIDGNICQILTGTSSSACCNLCGSKPSEMNNLDMIKRKKVNKEAFQYGLSSIHALIRFMESVLHVSYRLGFKKWTAKSSFDKEQLKSAKIRIQSELKQQLLLWMFPNRAVVPLTMVIQPESFLKITK